MAEQTIRKSLLSEQIFTLLRAEILGGEYTPGERLVEYDLAQRFQVSQAPVRDALRKLAQTGLVRQESRRGTFIEGLSAKSALDAYHVRAALEPMAVTQLLQRENEDLIPRLQAEVDGMVAVAKKDDLAALMEHDIAFHRLIWWESGNGLLPHFWPHVEQIWPLLEARIRNRTDGPNRLHYPDLETVAVTHIPLVQALERRDPEAPELFHAHVTAVWSQLESDVGSPTVD